MENENNKTCFFPKIKAYFSRNPLRTRIVSVLFGQIGCHYLGMCLYLSMPLFRGYTVYYIEKICVTLSTKWLIETFRTPKRSIFANNKDRRHTYWNLLLIFSSSDLKSELSSLEIYELISCIHGFGKQVSAIVSIEVTILFVQ